MVEKTSVTKQDIDHIISLLKHNHIKPLLQELKEWHHSDIAEIFYYLDFNEALLLLRSLDKTKAAEVFDFLNDELKEKMLDHLDDLELFKMLDKMPSDDIVSSLDLLNSNRRQEMLSFFSKQDMNELKIQLLYSEDSAGHMMTRSFIALNEEMTVKEVMEKTQGYEETSKEEIELPIFVVDKQARFEGVLPLHRLVFSKPDTLIKGLIKSEVKTIHTHAKTDDILNTFRKYEISYAPVIDVNNKLRGVLTVDDIIDLIKEENSEDMYRLAGSAETDPIRQPVWDKVRLRAPWLFITLIGGLLISRLMQSYQLTLDKVVALTFFIPLNIGMAGNVSLQSSTVLVRGLALGDVRKGRYLSTILRELLSGIIIALLASSVAVMTSYLMLGDPRFSLVIATAMSLSVSLAALNGSVIPLMCKEIGIDPAITSGPFVTTLNDFTGMLIFLFFGYLSACVRKK